MLLLTAALLLGAALPSAADVKEHANAKNSPFVKEFNQSNPASVLPSALDKFDDDFRHFRYVETINDYNDLSTKNRALPRVCYDIAFSRMRNHDFASAEAPLRRAIASGFPGYEGYPSPAQLLERIERLKLICPPLKSEIISGNARIKVYSREMPWLSSVNTELPKFLEAAKAAFGDSTPPITFYFFDNYSEYKQFFTTLFEVDGERENQEGTGDYGVVLFTARNATNEDTGKDLTFKHGCILHEYGHALCNTIYGDGYLEHVPDWLDEGLADEIARPYFNEKHFSSYKKHLTDTSAKEPPPTLAEMTKSMYEDSEYRYPFAHQMTEHLLEERGISMIRPLLLKAHQLKGDFEAAIKEVSGKTVESIYDQTASDFWK